MKLLLVEDNKSILLGLEYLMKDEGYETDVAHSYAEAMERYNTAVYDLVLLDINLPDGDGYELCRQMKRSQDIPVIFLTAREEEEDVVQGFELGADDYIRKPECTAPAWKDRFGSAVPVYKAGSAEWRGIQSWRAGEPDAAGVSDIKQYDES